MKTIVVVDDEIDSLDLVKDILNNDQQLYSIKDFLNPLEALDYINNNANTIDLIIADIMMPDLTGIELIKRCKKIEAIPILFLTCLDDHQTIKEAFAMKEKVLTITYQIKPLNFTMLLSSVETLIQTRDQYLDLYFKNINIKNLLKELGSENVYLYNRLTTILKLDEEKAAKLEDVRNLISGIFKNDLPLIKFISSVIDKNVDALDKIIAEGDEYFRVMRHISEPLKTVVSDIIMVVDLLISLGIINKSDMTVKDIEKTTFYGILLRLYSMGEFSTDTFKKFLEIADFDMDSKEEKEDVILF